MKKIIFVLIFSIGFLSGQIKKQTCIDYKTEIFDDKKYWDEIFYDAEKKPWSKQRKIQFPDSRQLKIISNSLIDSSVKSKSRCEMRWLLVDMNSTQKEVYGDSIETKFKTVEQKIYESGDGIKIGLIIVQTPRYEWQIGTIFLIDKGKIFTFSDYSQCEVKWKLCGVKKAGNIYKIYGHQEGNPDTPYYGKFILSVEGNKRKIEFEGYEEEGH